MEGYRFDGVLGWQADRPGDPDLQPDYFARVLRIHAAKPPAYRHFGIVLDWGQNRFAHGESEIAARFTETASGGGISSPSFYENRLVPSS